MVIPVVALLVVSSCGSHNDLTATTEVITSTTNLSTEPTATPSVTTTPITATTPITTTMTAPVTDALLCAVDALELVPSADGAMGSLYGGLAVHNISDAVCEVRGVPVIELIADDGTVVQSTDPANDTNDAPPVFLEPNSWAEVSLGIIGSNVCGGHQSSQLRFHWNGQVAAIPFAIGRPPDHESCEESYFDGPGPGHLQPLDTEGVAFAASSEP